MMFVVICRNWHLMWPEQSMPMAFFADAKEVGVFKEKCRQLRHDFAELGNV